MLTVLVITVLSLAGALSLEFPRSPPGRPAPSHPTRIVHGGSFTEALSTATDLETDLTGLEGSISSLVAGQEEHEREPVISTILLVTGIIALVIALCSVVVTGIAWMDAAKVQAALRQAKLTFQETQMKWGAVAQVSKAVLRSDAPMPSEDEIDAFLLQRADADESEAKKEFGKALLNLAIAVAAFATGQAIGSHPHLQDRAGDAFFGLNCVANEAYGRYMTGGYDEGCIAGIKKVLNVFKDPEGVQQVIGYTSAGMTASDELHGKSVAVYIGKGIATGLSVISLGFQIYLLYNLVRSSLAAFQDRHRREQDFASDMGWNACSYKKEILQMLMEVHTDMSICADVPGWVDPKSLDGCNFWSDKDCVTQRVKTNCKKSCQICGSEYEAEATTVTAGECRSEVEKVMRAVKSKAASNKVYEHAKEGREQSFMSHLQSTLRTSCDRKPIDFAISLKHAIARLTVELVATCHVHTKKIDCVSHLTLWDLTKTGRLSATGSDLLNGGDGSLEPGIVRKIVRRTDQLSDNLRNGYYDENKQPLSHHVGVKFGTSHCLTDVHPYAKDGTIKETVKYEEMQEQHFRNVQWEEKSHVWEQKRLSGARAAKDDLNADCGGSAAEMYLMQRKQGEEALPEAVDNDKLEASKKEPGRFLCPDDDAHDQRGKNDCNNLVDCEWLGSNRHGNCYLKQGPVLDSSGRERCPDDNAHFQRGKKDCNNLVDCEWSGSNKKGGCYRLSTLSGLERTLGRHQGAPITNIAFVAKPILETSKVTEDEVWKTGGQAGKKIHLLYPASQSSQNLLKYRTQAMLDYGWPVGGRRQLEVDMNDKCYKSTYSSRPLQGILYRKALAETYMEWPQLRTALTLTCEVARDNGGMDGEVVQMSQALSALSQGDKSKSQVHPQWKVPAAGSTWRALQQTRIETNNTETSDFEAVKMDNVQGFLLDLCDHSFTEWEATYRKGQEGKLQHGGIADRIRLDWLESMTAEWGSGKWEEHSYMFIGQPRENWPLDPAKQPINTQTTHRTSFNPATWDRVHPQEPWKTAP